MLYKLVLGDALLVLGALELHDYFKLIYFGVPPHSFLCFAFAFVFTRNLVNPVVLRATRFQLFVAIDKVAADATMPTLVAESRPGLKIEQDWKR